MSFIITITYKKASVRFIKFFSRRLNSKTSKKEKYQLSQLKYLRRVGQYYWQLITGEAVFKFLQFFSRP